MRQRSTFNPISGDLKQPLLLKVAWVLFNIFEQYRPQPFFKNMSAFPVNLSHVDKPFVPKSCSPSRLASLLFWHDLPGEEIVSALGGHPPRICEVGCGNGNGKHIYDLNIPGLASYTGLDILRRDNWVKITTEDARCNFHEVAAENITDDLVGDANLIFSQSAIEHFPEDLRFGDIMRRYAGKRDFPIIHVHMIPTGRCWRQCGLHGYRGYDERSVEKLVQYFDPDDHHVFLLGGQQANRIHSNYVFDLITNRAGDKRKEKESEYFSSLCAALADDNKAPPKRMQDASFLALVMTYRASADIFRRLR